MTDTTGSHVPGQGAKMSGTTPRLRFGQFYGAPVAEAEVGHLLVRELHGRPPEGVPRHTHESAHFCLVVRGDYETTTRNLNGRCGPSTLLFHPAGTTHDDHVLSESGSCLMLALPAAFLDGLDGPRLQSRSLAIDDAEIGFPGARIVQELRGPDRFSRLTLEGLALEMVSRALARPERVDGAPVWLERARSYIHDHAVDPARVGEVAAAAGVHPVHLARVFRERLGLSPGEYLRRVRVRAAMEMIGTSNVGLAAVAIRAGFCDQSEMTRAFRREIGSTPSAYRRILRG